MSVRFGKSAHESKESRPPVEELRVCCGVSLVRERPFYLVQSQEDDLLSLGLHLLKFIAICFRCAAKRRVEHPEFRDGTIPQGEKRLK
ncbi:MAG: hypothetical protein JNL80_11775 [Phycisphaerae bacterium]|nr:hypothetical protein [Phycisphaerae bacterium]